MRKVDIEGRLKQIKEELSLLREKLARRATPESETVLKSLEHDLSVVRASYLAVDLSASDALVKMANNQGVENYILDQIKAFTEPDKKKAALEQERVRLQEELRMIEQLGTR